jgi:hypothetical protein
MAEESCVDSPSGARGILVSVADKLWGPRNLQFNVYGGLFFPGERLSWRNAHTSSSAEVKNLGICTNFRFYHAIIVCMRTTLQLLWSAVGVVYEFSKALLIEISFLILHF